MSMLPVGFGASGDYTIEESLRFNASQSSYLSWTPASAGNRTTWTWSGWVKRGSLGSKQSIFGAGEYDGSPALTSVYFYTDDTVYLEYWDTTNNPRKKTTQVFRDVSAWYHFVFVWDTGNATANNRIKMYVNGAEITTFAVNVTPSLNFLSSVNNNTEQYIGRIGGLYPFDGYITEVNFIDGQALDPSSFGEFDATTGVWKPKGYTGTYGTNGFYLPMKLDNTTEGFNTVTYIGNGSTNKIGGVGFSPDLVWIKKRDSADQHMLINSVSGGDKWLSSNLTSAENSGSAFTFDSDGFSPAPTSGATNSSGQSYVAWCWDAGSSTVSNTDGSITSSVRANPTYGFSIVTYTGNGATSSGVTIGHGLGATPAFIITKKRSGGTDYGWSCWHKDLGGNYGIWLDKTNARNVGMWDGYINFSSTVFTPPDLLYGNESGATYVNYCFSEVSGYSKFGSYTGTGASGNVVTTGFKPAFVMVKRTDTTSNWVILDNTRRSVNPNGLQLYPNLSAAEDDYTATLPTDFTDTGFTLNHNTGNTNASGGTYIYMAFKDTREYAFWLDDSGNNNDWQPNGGITTSSTVTDTPTPYLGGGNYAVLNPIEANPVGTRTISNANLDIALSYGSGVICYATMAVPTSGKWYWEVTAKTVDASNASPLIGVFRIGDPAGNTYDYVDSVAYRQSGVKQTASGVSAYGTSYTNGDVIGIAVDMDNQAVYFSKNNTWQNSGDPTSGASKTGAAITSIPQQLKAGIASSVNTTTSSFNFGQRPFAYTPPTGFKALHTGNLPDSSIVDGSKYFDAVLYSGSTASEVSVTGLGFQPDFVWDKNRNNAYNHYLWDAVRGATKYLSSNLTTTETTDANSLKSFDSDGFTLGAGATFATMSSGNSHVGWAWKANGTGVSNTDGSITSTVSANPTAGFSIVSYTGTGSAATVGHGLGVAPKMVIIKNRDSAQSWWTGTTVIDGSLDVLYLNLTNAKVDSSSAVPTSTVFDLGTSSQNNGAGNNHVAYCFAEVEGYSRISSFVGNGSADGVFVYTGFRPAFVLIKRTDVLEQWHLLDGKRDPYNYMDNELYANLSNAEAVVGSARIDFVSNGIKIRTSNSGYNASGGTYIYMVFAENPFKNSLAR